MGRLFNRSVVVNVGGLRLASTAIDGSDKPMLRVKFKVVRSLKKDPNTAQIQIFNLTKSNRVKLQEKNIATTIDAGYVDGVSQIFGGVLQFGSSVKSSNDWVTTVQSGDGGGKFKSARINTSFKGPITISNVLQTAGEALGVNLGNLAEKVSVGSIRSELQELSEGIVLSGKAERVFDKIVKMMGYSWSIQNNQIQILGPSETITSADAVLLTSSTGLVGSPEPGEDGFVSARSLLQPDLLPGRRVRIKSREVDGFFRVEKVVFLGDTWRGDWYSDIEVKPL